MKKISLSGPLGCGKTVLGQEVQKILSLKYKVALLGDIKLRSPFDSDKQSLFVSRFFNITSQVNEENIKSQNEPDLMICDNSVIDQWVNWLYYYNSIEQTDTAIKKHEIMKNLSGFWLPTYDLVFKIHSDPKKCGERRESEEVTEKELLTMKETAQMYDDILENCCTTRVIDIWNNGPIDESSFRIVEHITEILEEK